MGFLELRAGERTLTPSAPKLRSLLALLALRSNHIVTTGTLIEELWGNHPPISALATLQTYIYQLRRVLTEVDPGEQILKTKPLGYVISLGHDELDLNLFQDHVTNGRSALDHGDAETAATALGQALELSLVAPLADVEAGPVLAAHVNELAESRLHALELRIEADLRLGRYRELIAELKILIAEYPFHEDFYAKLMLSLERSGRRSEALEVYQQLRTSLMEELGIEPSTKVRKLQAQLLAAHQEPRWDAESGPATIPPVSSRFARPAQLPRDLPDFTGRAATVATLCDLAVGTERTTSARVLNVTGMPGIGKSAVTLHVAHLIRDQFTDGQFYADLRASTDRPADPYAVLGQFLHATGLKDAELPGDLDERAQMFRSWTADRNVLVVLDDVASAAQIRALLPGGRRCMVLVASCSSLPDLEGAKTVELEPLDLESCVDLLAALISRERVEREEDMAYSIAALCGRLPLAIRMIGTKLAVSPSYPLRRIVLRLSDERRLLHELHTGEYDLRARLARNHARLSPDARRLLSCMVRAGTKSDVTLGIVAALADLEPFTAELLLEELVRSHFLGSVDLNGHGSAGFVIHPTVRSFVLHTLTEHIPQPQLAGHCTE